MKKLVVALMVVSNSLLVTGTVCAQKIGWVNMQKIFNDMPEMARVDSAARAYQQQLYQQYISMQAKLQKDAGAFIKDSAGMSGPVKEVKRGSLQNLNKRIMQFRQSMDDHINQKYNQLVQPVIDKVQAAINAIAKEKGYTHVIRDQATTSSGQFELLVVKPAKDDLTAAVKAKLGIKK